MNSPEAGLSGGASASNESRSKPPSEQPTATLTLDEHDEYPISQWVLALTHVPTPEPRGLGRGVWYFREAFGPGPARQFAARRGIRIEGEGR